MNDATFEPRAPQVKTPEESTAGDDITSDCTVIELHLRRLSQLFDSLDPSPFHERDLDRNADDYIVDSAKELPARTDSALVLYLDEPPHGDDEPRVVKDAIRVHFARRSRVLQRGLRQLIRRGLVSLCIGLAFLAVVFIIAQVVMRQLGESALALPLREGLLIVGWVAMWKPLEIFLYDWWPILGERRLYDRLRRLKGRSVYKASRPSSPSDPLSD